MFCAFLLSFCLFVLADSTVPGAEPAVKSKSTAAKLLIPQAPQNRNLFCFNCYEMIDIIEQTFLLDEPGLKTRLDNWCDTVYGHMGDMAKQCKQWIDTDLDAIVDKLNNGWSAEEICKDLHLCD